MDNSKIDSNIKLILDLRNNKGIFPLSTESAIIAHSPGGEMTYLDSVIDYLYQLVASKLRLYTELDGNNTRGKAYPATMGLIDAANIASLLSNMDRYFALLNTLQQQVNNMDPTDDVASMNNIINHLKQDFNNLMLASKYTYLEIKFSDSSVMPSSNLDNSDYWESRPLSDFNHLWLGVRTVTVERGPNGEAIITKGTPTIVSLKGPRGEQGPPGPRGATGNSGESYKAVFMYKWTDSRTTVPNTPTNPLNEGWSEDPGTYIENAKYLWMTLNLKRISTNTYIDSWSTPVCLSGEDGTSASLGLMGPVVRFRGEYTTGTEYINASLDTDLSSTAIRYIDVVMVTSGLIKTYYMVKPTDNDTRRTLVSPTTSGQLDWEEATGYSFIAAEALYAQNAHIDNLSGYEFLVLDGHSNIVAGMTGGDVEDSVVTTNSPIPVRIWAGSNAKNNIDLYSDAIPFKVFQNGKLKATNAEIKGDLSIDSLLLTGNGESYYYDRSSITLPKIHSNKHKVIFIITAGTETQVTSLSGDVLFAFYNNGMQTTNSTTLSTYKIYLAISINNGQSSGWLLLNLNALELLSSMGYYSRDIALPLQQDPPTIYSEIHNNELKLYLKRNFGSICSFKTADTSEYLSATSPGFYIEGNIDFETMEEDHITTLHLSSFLASSISGLGANEVTGYITMGDIIDIYYNHENDSPKTIYLDGNGWTITIFKNPNNPTLDLIEISMPLKEGIDSGTQIKVIPSISLVESFNYVINPNYSVPVTTTTVGSNGLVINKGSIVATDMPTGAVVNAKDCIVYKDITVDPDNKEYEVTNYGNLDVSIGNYTLNPGNSVLVKATTNAHIDFSDITAIDSGDIFDTDPLTPAGEFNG